MLDQIKEDNPSILFQLLPSSPTLQDTEGKTHVLSATASTKKPDEVKTEDTTTDEPPSLMEGVAEAGKTSAGDGEKATSTDTPSTEPGPSGVAAATGQEEEVKTKPTEKKSEVSVFLLIFSTIASD